MKSIDFKNICSDVASESKSFQDLHVPLRDINYTESVSRKPLLRVGNRDYIFTDDLPVNQIANRLSIPSTYFYKCPTYLQKINFMYWKEKKLQANPDASWFIRMKNDRIRAVLNENFVKFDNIDLLKSMKKFIGNKNVRIVFSNINPHTYSLRVIFLRWPHSSKNNGDIFPGISLLNSEVGLTPFEAKVFVYTKVCENGMLSPQNIDSIQKRSVKDDELWKYNFSEFLKGSYKKGTQLAERLTKSKLFVLESPKEFLAKKFMDKFPMSQNFKDNLIKVFNRAKPKSLYDVVNVITLASQSCDISERSKFEELAGSLVLDHDTK